MFKSRFRQYGYESSRLRRLSPTTNVTLTNLVTNGDFSNGTTGWDFVSNADVVEGQYYSSGGVGLCRQFIAIETGHDIVAFCKCSRLNGYAALVLSDGTGMYDGRVYASGLTSTGEWRTGYVRRTVVGGGTYLYFGSTSSSAVGASYADDIILIDLTDLNAALGREVTVGEMNSYMAQFDNNWFNGSVVISV